MAASDSVVYLPPTDASLADLAYALAAGCPVVASAVPATTELLKDGQTAWFCLPDSPKDAARRMLQAIENPDQSCRQAHQARALAQRVFAAPLLIDGYRHMYLNLASRRPAASAQTHTGGAL